MIFPVFYLFLCVCCFFFNLVFSIVGKPCHINKERKAKHVQALIRRVVLLRNVYFDICWFALSLHLSVSPVAE